MIDFNKNRLDEIFNGFGSKKIAVIGDLMLDRYIWGSVSRISPEAPVPVVEVDRETYMFGGAANVNFNVMSLGAGVIPVGLIGNDQFGDVLESLFKEKGFPLKGIIRDDKRTTTVKTRIIAHNQHVVRIDREERNPVTESIKGKILDYFESIIDSIDGIIFEDYNKGLLAPDLVKSIISMAKEKGVMTFVDPKYENFFEYRGVTLFKPNKKEAADKLGFKLDSDDNLERGGDLLLDKIKCDALLITLSEKGMALFEKGRERIIVPTKAVKVHDVSGAGDTVIATMAVAMCSGADLHEAATIANHAAGIVCGEVGIVPVEKTRLYNELNIS
ncbi:D-glycero-beta-D-manno-heptose-7-phosphate kinase [candidate division KSB1 bacterium]|nr:MAG: D-glycero-beta-D-manno-heptose-7-phosphate kinase [candidate division KSB1 bacterium]